MWERLAWLAAAGALGTCSRYFLAGWVERSLADWVQQWTGVRFPLGTLAVNVLGCFAFGVVWTLWDRGRLNLETRMMVLIGFMGAFTTFSAFAFETVNLLEGQRWLLAAGNVLIQNAVGVGAILLGFAVGEWL